MKTPTSLDELPTGDECENAVPQPVYPLASDAEHWLAKARGGSAASLGNLAESCRQYLLLVANAELDAALRGKLGASDLVQETLLTVQQAFDRFTGSSEEEFRRWAKRILLNKIAHASRFYGQVAKRDIHREQPTDDPASGRNAWFGVVDPAMTPCGNAIANEQALAIEEAMGRLPERYQLVITLRCFERRSFDEIGRLLDISAEAGRKLWCRAIDRLRREWEVNDESGGLD